MWNAAIDRRPAAIVRCTSTAEVVAAVGLARERGWPVAVRGGGHNVAGLAVGDGALVVDCSRWRGVRVDGRVTHVDPGALTGDLDAATQAAGLAAPGGIMSTTGVAGFTLGGGIGLHAASEAGLRGRAGSSAPRAAIASARPTARRTAPGSWRSSHGHREQDA